MLDLDAIEAAEKAMTPGPLTQKHCRVSDRLDNTLAYTNHRADAEGIVILRNAAPEMFRRIREQEAEIARLREACEDYLKWVRTPHHHLPIEETVKQRWEILERMEAALEQKGGAN